MCRFRWLVLACLLGSCWTPGCMMSATGTGTTPSEVAKLSAYTFYDEGSQLTLMVGTRPMLHRTERPYLPLEIAVANHGLPSATFTPESFTLEDAEGRTYPLATVEELKRSYGSTDVDRRLGELPSILQRKYRTYERIESNFTPGFDEPIARDVVMLPRFALFEDMLYFPNPEIPTRPGSYALLVKVPEAPTAFVVRFFLNPSG